MPLLPEWAPNVHPMIVHFPIALLIVALLFDLAALVFKKHNWLQKSAAILYIAGGLFVAAAFLSGRQAADSVNVPAIVNPTLGEHADWGLRTLWYFGLYGVIRLFLLWKNIGEKWVLSLVIFLIGAAGMFVLFETAEHGAELVFRHGIGVQAAEQARSELEQIRHENETLSTSGLQESPNGSWKWLPGSGAEVVLKRQFTWLLGSPTDVEPALNKDAANGEVLGLTLANNRVLFTAGKPLTGVQADVRLNLDKFTGTFMLVHHVQDAANFDFISLEGEKMILGRMENGKATIEDEDETSYSGWFTLRAVGDGRHFRGYMNEKLVAHGHGNPLPPGTVGLFIHGNGQILIDEIVVQSLR